MIILFKVKRPSLRTVLVRNKTKKINFNCFEVQYYVNETVIFFLFVTSKEQPIFNKNQIF